MDFFYSWTWIIIMFLLLVGLIIVFFVLRGRREED